MLKTPRYIWFLALLVLLFAAWMHWWASSGFPLEGQICEATNSPKDWNSYNVIFYSAWRLARATDHWSALITGIATVVLAVITRRLVALGIEQSATTRAQLRAYLSVVIGLGVNQDRVRELKFEAKPFILNNGETPAYNVRVRIKAEILTDVQIPNFVFIEPPDVPQSQASIGPKENRTMSGLLDRYVPDDEVQDICDGNGEGFVCLGRRAL
jgi:hypothetical protein